MWTVLYFGFKCVDYVCQIKCLLNTVNSEMFMLVLRCLCEF
jgi:hypothetical protein